MMAEETPNAFQAGSPQTYISNLPCTLADVTESFNVWLCLRPYPWTLGFIVPFGSVFLSCKLASPPSQSPEPKPVCVPPIT